MKTFVILSDTHRNTKPQDKIATVLAECDYIIHLGDMAGDARELMHAYPERRTSSRATTISGAAKAKSCSTRRVGASSPATATATG